VQHLQPEEIELRPTVYLALQILQTGDLSLDLPVTFHPRLARSHSRITAIDP
jgi:hypothetical protein